MAAPDPRRLVPRTDAVLGDERVAEARDRLGAETVRAAIHQAQQRVRTGEIAPGDVVAETLATLPVGAHGLVPVLNATGVVVHTNLGRAPLSAAARAALADAAGAVDLEFDLASGRRSRRGASATAALLERVPAAGDALIVNNGAAALALVAQALAGTTAQRHEVIISRGELIEIGDGFRLPALIEATGAILREVGTTNRVHLDDYAAAVTDRTAFVLKIHPSNFAVTGFTSAVPVRELATLGPPVVADIGSGLLGPDPLLPAEPDAATWLADGAALVTASGDKLLGGPQAGLLLGTADLVQRIRRHPLARAVRVDKLTLAALEATVRTDSTPVRAALHADPDVLRRRAERLALDLTAAGCRASVVPSVGVVGGGGAPGVGLAGWAVAVHPDLAQPLRTGRPAVVGRVEKGHCLLDLRCVPADLDDTVRAAVLSAVGEIDRGRPCT